MRRGCRARSPEYPQHRSVAPFECSARLLHDDSMWRNVSTLAATIGALIAPGCSGASKAVPPPAPATSQAPSASAADALQGATALHASGRYGEARDLYRLGLRSARDAGQAPVRLSLLNGVSEIALLTGAYAEALSTAERVRAEADEPVTLRAAWQITIAAQRQTGELSAALASCEAAAAALPGDLEIALLKGQILLEQGQSVQAQLALMSIIEAYNEEKFPKTDAESLALVGRAAYFLRSPEDANDAFNESELAGAASYRTLLWRAELYQDRHDTGHAAEVIEEILATNPNHPDALVARARIYLEEALDFDAAGRSLKKALATNPRHLAAHAVQAGIAIRDTQLREADAVLDQGLSYNPRALELLSLKAAVRFLSDDLAGYERVKSQVLGLNPSYSTLHQVVGTYAEWEHRYDAIVDIMREGVQVDPDDAKAHARLGINLIRAGQDEEGIFALRTAFRKDPYNVRVYNTLKLYEEILPQSYVDVPAGDRFAFRFPKSEREILEPYATSLLASAWDKFVGYYQFTPDLPVGVELYSERENFAIRTSGLPQTAIQGVCFGRTLASMTPRHEDFNLGMTLWHELAHVFHIQLSKNHVPRWFTEGLAEYETLVERKEWRRERDAELYAAYRAKRLPKIGAMNEAFTHAEALSDITVAYYASTKIVEMIADSHGRLALQRMLELWAQGKRTPEVVQTALGKTPEALDAQFEQVLRRSLARYTNMFVPRERVGDPKSVRQALATEPENPDRLVRYARLALSEGQLAEAKQSVAQALATSGDHPGALYLSGIIALKTEDYRGAKAASTRLLAANKDGYKTRMMLASALEQLGDKAAAKSEYARAHRHDPSQSEPLYRLLQSAIGAKDDDAAWQLRQKLALLEENDAELYRDLATAAIERGFLELAQEHAVSAVHADADSPLGYLVLGRVRTLLGKTQLADQAFKRARSAPGDDATRKFIAESIERFQQRRQ